MASQATVHDNPSRTKPIWLCRYASEFLEAALVADSKMGRRDGFEIVAPIPVLFLVGQLVELVLKAFLLSRGVPLQKLRYDYGYNLHRSLQKAKELGLSALVELAPDELSTIEVFDGLCSSKFLQLR